MESLLNLNSNGGMGLHWLPSNNPAQAVNVITSVQHTEYEKIDFLLFNLTSRLGLRNYRLSCTKTAITFISEQQLSDDDRYSFTEYRWLFESPILRKL